MKGRTKMEENNNSNSSYRMVNFSERDNKTSFGKTIFVPFISGIVGASLVMGVCFGIPNVKSQILGTESVSANTVSLPTITTSKTELTSYSDVGAYAANKILPSIVGITVDFTVSSIFGQQGSAKAGGSGIILTQDGYIVTNNHVISGTSSSSMFYKVSDANKITVNLYGSDETYEAKIIGTDEKADIAIIKIEADNLTPAEIGNSDELKLGEFAMVAGNPLGYDFSVTSGSISAINREITDDDGNTYSLIQTDAAINSGNSGGALVNSAGKVVGISFMKIASTEVEGICFAIPITPHLDTINQLITTGKVKRPYIGIVGTDIDSVTANRYNMVEGIFIREIDPESNAAKSGLQPKDVIIEVDGKKIKSMDSLNNYKYTKKVGDKIKIKVDRNGEHLEFEIELTEEQQEQ